MRSEVAFLALRVLRYCSASSSRAVMTRVSPGHVAVYEIFRTAFDQNGKPFRVTVMVFPIDRNQFIVNAGDVPAHWFGADDDLYEPT